MKTLGQQIWILWIRINVIFGWPFIYFLDVMIWLTDYRDWKILRKESNEKLLQIWNRKYKG